MIDRLFQDKKLCGQSKKWANWMSKLSITTCMFCAKNHGKIVDISVLSNKYEVNAHLRCKCVYVPMRVKVRGTATNLGPKGADIYLAIYQCLPNYYVSKEEAENAGWLSWQGNLYQVCPHKMIGGDVYKNREGKLPDRTGRIWYEADINYDGGFRNDERIIFSNDGLIFVTYDHYETFYEVIK